MIGHNKVIRFLILTLALCFAWFLLYEFWLTNLDNWLTQQVANSAVILLNLIGYNSGISNTTTVVIAGVELVYVNHSCNGMVLLALFAGFIIVFPGPPFKKLAFISIGILLLHLLNIIRVVGLALNAYHHHFSLNFNHKYTFAIIVYMVIFVLWMIWVREYSGLHKHG